VFLNARHSCRARSWCPTAPGLRVARIFSPARGSSSQSASGGHADRCRASHSGAGPRRDFPVPRRRAVVGFHRMATDGLAMVCSPSRARFTSRPAAFNSSTRSSTNRRASAVFTNGGSASSRNVRSPNSLNPTPSRVSAASLFAQKFASASRQLDGLRQQQFLRRRGTARLNPVQHLLEQNRSCGVLIQQDESAVGFEYDVKFADDADERSGTFSSGMLPEDGSWEMGRWSGGFRRG